MSTSCSKDERLIVQTLYALVRDIPYGNIGVRDPAIVLKQKSGSCSGKHLLLGQLLELSGIEFYYMMGETDLRGLNPLLPQPLQSSEEVIDFHNYLKVRVANKWLNVDASFDAPLKALNLPVTLDWSADTHCLPAFETTNDREVSDLINEKERALLNLPESARSLREQMLTAFAEQIKNVRQRVDSQSSSGADERKGNEI